MISCSCRDNPWAHANAFCSTVPPVFAAGSAGVDVLAVAVGGTMGLVALPVAVIDVGLMTLP